MADALNNLAPVPMMTGDLRLARRFAAQARDMWQGLGDPWQAALATLALGMSSLLEGAYAQALTYFEEFLPVVRARGDRFWLISGLTSMAQAQHFLDRFEQARGSFGEALGLALEANDLASVTVALGSAAASLAIGEDAVARASRLRGREAYVSTCQRQRTPPLPAHMASRAQSALLRSDARR
jgi:hypothetical protein